jgi:uncharacterized cupin superfamily protein
MKRPILNLEDVEYARFGQGDRFEAKRGPVSPIIGGEKLTYAVIRVAPGKRAWPYHAHREIEEAFYIIEGQGTLRHAGEEYAIRAGDFIASPADPEQAHQIINTSDNELVYLAISTQETTDVVHYPDSGKYGVWSGDSRDPFAAGNFRVFAREGTAVGYWDGETD